MLLGVVLCAQPVVAHLEDEIVPYQKIIDEVAQDTDALDNYSFEQLYRTSYWLKKCEECPSFSIKQPTRDEMLILAITMFPDARSNWDVIQNHPYAWLVYNWNTVRNSYREALSLCRDYDFKYRLADIHIGFKLLLDLVPPSIDDVLESSDEAGSSDEFADDERD